MNPTDLSVWANLLGDTVDLIPFVTGVGETIKALRTSSKIAEGTDKEVHHIIDKRFAKSLGVGNYNEMLSVSLDKRTHRQYTNAWRKALNYGKNIVRKKLSVQQHLYIQKIQD